MGATQLKQAPNPQAMWFSRERSQGTSNRSAIRESRGQHGRGAATDDLRGTITPFEAADQKIGHETVMTGRAIIRRQLDRDARLFKVGNSRRQ